MLLCLLPAVCGIAPAQTTGHAGHRTSGQITDYWVARWEADLVGVAEAMPADKYSFAPTNGAFNGVRTFAQQVKHVAAANHILAANISGANPPADAGDETGPDAVRTKPEIIAYLKDSFAALHRAAKAIDDNNTVIKSSPISPLKGGGTRFGLAIEALVHSANHYGQMIEYLRMNGIVPPRSR